MSIRVYSVGEVLGKCEKCVPLIESRIKDHIANNNYKHVHVKYFRKSGQLYVDFERRK